MPYSPGRIIALWLSAHRFQNRVHSSTLSPRALRCRVLLLSMLWAPSLYSQEKTVKGTIMHQFTKENIPFASISWKRAGNGTLSDSLGNFKIVNRGYTDDTLLISYVGFSDLGIPLTLTRDIEGLVFYLDEAKQGNAVIVSSKYNKGLLWWRKIVKNKSLNNPYRYSSFAYELYNKLELDLNNISRDGFKKYKLLRPFSFILDNIDSVSENTPFLPVFMSESLSDYYYRSKPYQVREEIKAVKTNGIKNETVMQFIGGTNQRINAYENFISLFGKEFISPLSKIGDNYYNYRGADTQYISGQRYLHLYFYPKREGQNTFSGDCWIHDESWAIKKINLEISATANINYINRLHIIQEFARQNDTTWVFAKDKMVADVSPMKKNKLSLIARKTSMYKNVEVDQPFTESKLSTNTQKEQVVILDSAYSHGVTYWQQNRHEHLSNNEEHLYYMIDTLKTIPLFRKYSNAIEFIIDGHIKYGKIEIGPWYKWISANQLEKFRVRFDLGTTEEFSNYLWLHGYLAYGFGDKELKGKIESTYKLPGKSGYSFMAAYTHDLDNGRIHFNEEDVTTDNMFSQLIRRPGVIQKFLGLDEIKLAINKEWQNKLSAHIQISKTDYETFRPLPAEGNNILYPQDIVNTELGLKLRYAPAEKKIETHHRLIRIRSSLPVFEARYSIGMPGVLQGGFHYRKLTASITENVRIPRWGKINYTLYGGQIFDGPLPFMLLEVHPGNEIYYYSKQAFNLMNRFEFVSDRYIGFTVEHNFEKKLLNLLPFMRKSNMRQFWNVKSVWGDLTAENRKLNRVEYGDYRFRYLKGRPYIELGTGLDNIFKVFRLDLVWRYVSPMRLAPGVPPALYKNSTSSFGIFGSFHLQF